MFFPFDFPTVRQFFFFTKKTSWRCWWKDCFCPYQHEDASFVEDANGCELGMVNGAGVNGGGTRVSVLGVRRHPKTPLSEPTSVCASTSKGWGRSPGLDSGSGDLGKSPTNTQPLRGRAEEDAWGRSHHDGPVRAPGNSQHVASQKAGEQDGVVHVMRSKRRCLFGARCKWKDAFCPFRHPGSDVARRKPLPHTTNTPSRNGPKGTVLEGGEHAGSS